MHSLALHMETLYRIDCDAHHSVAVAVAYLPAYNCCKPREFTRICAWETRIAMSHRLTLQFWFVRSGGRMKFGVVQSVVAYSKRKDECQVREAQQSTTADSGQRADGTALRAEDGIHNVGFGVPFWYDRPAALLALLYYGIRKSSRDMFLRTMLVAIRARCEGINQLGFYILVPGPWSVLYKVQSLLLLWMMLLGSTGGQSSAKLEAAYGDLGLAAWQPGHSVASFPLDWLLAEFEGLFEIARPKESTTTTTTTTT
ncbi:hypothetical protein FPSE_08635 [Fusarium pseudograminearum CS3096]|uniref:Uncharacterized protein n=1 Tax=Fusarium pseudograminearum (strain CS3096) TaxID=1028729 RepID=K3VBY4_FUSPC|nr:hypothetical protein FPSE_08635 [Fusarium pseudograminearum CS3096]EKJ71129.1 hypothetical protein FPSE_08635 [Fusarium pseudograminearum CS3096]